MFTELMTILSFPNESAVRRGCLDLRINWKTSKWIDFLKLSESFSNLYRYSEEIFVF